MRGTIMKTIRIAFVAMAVALTFGVTGAEAACVTKGAIATSDSEKSAKWYALETMVQAVSWGLWPGFLANGKVEGYRITGERYTCKKDGGGVTCRGRATFCKI
jgi:hypothetical protein